MEISSEKLKDINGNYDWYNKFGEGYRVVYFYEDDTYKIGTYCKKIEDFMMDFVEIEPIEDESYIPPFLSITNLLERYLQTIKDINAVAIYKTDGTCIAEKKREI